jgi:hypothetical protein
VINQTYLTKGAWVAECTECDWLIQSDSMADTWVMWRLHDKREHQ